MRQHIEKRLDQTMMRIERHHEVLDDLQRRITAINEEVKKESIVADELRAIISYADNEMVIEKYALEAVVRYPHMAIECIKDIRAKFNLGLREAKNFYLNAKEIIDGR